MEATATGPDLYVRVNLTKNSKGYSHETTVSVRLPMPDAADPVVAVGGWVADLLEEADRRARHEIARRTSLDEWGA